MIIQGIDKLEVGKKYFLRIWDKFKNEHRGVPTFILRESNYNEWYNFIEREGALDQLNDGPTGPYFYEVSID